MNINFQLIKALCKRDLRLYFANPTGYVFITLFIFLSAAAAFWQERFFLNNLANLDQLNSVFPFLLMLFVPAITMGVWAEERRQGTDELLLTLPATDLEIVLGKYFSTVGIYTAALLLSLSHVVVLFWLGHPDLGLMLGNYFGYWLLGAAFIAIGMFSSLLSPNVTVAYILAGIMCAFFVYVQPLLGVFGRSFGDSASALAVFNSFGDFSRGVVSLTGLLYFLSLTGFMLFLNVIMLGRRHWLHAKNGVQMHMHKWARVAALAVALIALNTVVARMSFRVDLTEEKLHSLSSETRRLLKEIPADRPVLVQAYMSKDVPKTHVQTRANLYGLLKEIDALGGDKVQVVINDTEQFSDEARDARERFGIQPVEVPDVDARAQMVPVFMGVAFTCGAEEDVIPFLDRGLPAEYELVRSIRVVARTERKKIGVLNTQVNLFGGFDFNTYQTQPAWPVVNELKKQYEVVRISATDPITEPLDGLLIALPSSLPQEEMDNVLPMIKAGTPTLLLVDPVPVINVGLAPLEESGAQTNPFARSKGPQPKPKGNIRAMLTELGIEWNPGQVVYDRANPHPDLASLQPEIVFINRANQNPRSFNEEVPASSGLQEVVLLYPGTISAAPRSDLTFEPFLATSAAYSGALDYRQLVQRSFFGVQLAQGGVPHYDTPDDYVVGARSYSRADTSGTGGVNVIVLSDLDFISDQFFQLRRMGIENLNFDNIALFLNCMDMLVGDDSFLALRKRRVKHRTLETVEKKTRTFAERRATEERQAEAEAQQALGEAQQRLNEKVAEVQQRVDLDDQTKQIMARNLQEAESRRFEALKANINAERDTKIARSKEAMESQIRSIQSNIKTLAGLLPPIPVFVMGIMIFLKRQRREKEGAAAARRLRSQ